MENPFDKSNINSLSEVLFGGQDLFKKKPRAFIREELGFPLLGRREGEADQGSPVARIIQQLLAGQG